MKHWARLQGNVVVELFNETMLPVDKNGTRMKTPERPPSHPSLVWVECTETTREGMIHEDGEFTNEADDE